MSRMTIYLPFCFSCKTVVQKDANNLPRSHPGSHQIALISLSEVIRVGIDLFIGQVLARCDYCPVSES
jgi:hypothetical protein